MNKRLFNIVLAATLVFNTTACSKDDGIDVIEIPPSDGKTQTLSGGTGGASAVNSAFIDLSTDKQDSVLRSSWDLGFYSGSEFRVILNYTASAGAKVIAKNDLAQVTAADTAGLTLAVIQANLQPSDLAYFDDASGDITKTVIPAISSVDAENKVIILNRGTGGGIAARPWLKLRVLRNASGGYTVQYAELTETTFKTISVDKDPAYNFKFVSFTTNGIVNAEPKKAEWDMQWTYSVYKTSFESGEVPYNFSDLVTINFLAGVQAAEILTGTVTYADYKETNISTTTFSNNRWTIGSNWRATTGTVGVKTDRFYVIKDPVGNVYKLKFNSFHANDGGVRGYPVIEYKLVKKA